MDVVQGGAGRVVRRAMRATIEPSGNSTEHSATGVAVLLTRTMQEPIQGLRDFSGLILVGSRATANPEAARAGFANALEGECLACGIKVSGEEILALGAEGATDGPKVERLRKGYCARRTCDSRFYQITCKPAAGIDWSPIFAMKEGYASVPDVAKEGEEGIEDSSELSANNRRVIFAVAAVSAMLLFIVGWQLYAGGSIPFLREPEKFQVDTAPDVLQLMSSQ